MSYGQVNKQNGDIIPYAGSAIKVFPNASQVPYDNTDSGMTAAEVQSAVDELKEIIDSNPGTTYTLSVGTGADANKIILTPSEGEADKITVPYSTSAGDANTVNGKTVAVDVPADAKFTDNNTTYSFANGTNGFTVTPSGGSAQTVTVTPNDTTKLPLAGGTLTGQLKLSANGLRTDNDNGYSLDSYGNLKSLSSTATNYLHLDNYEGAAQIKMYWATGNIVTNGSITAASFAGSIAGATGMTSSQVTTALGYTPANSPNMLYNNNDIPEGATNLSNTATAHKITTYRNGFTIPYQMDNANDGGIIRCRGTSESNCIFEIGTWDDSGSGETIQFNYYPTTSQVTPTYSVSVPKKSGVIALDSDISALRSSFQAGVDSVYNAIKAQGTTPASKSLSDVVNAVSTMSNNRYNSGYNKGVSDADGRSNPGSYNYQTGYNKGVSDADGRSNPSSYNYQTGYNAGYAQGKADGTPSYKTQTLTHTENNLSQKYGKGKDITFTFNNLSSLLGISSYSLTSGYGGIGKISISGNSAVIGIKSSGDSPDNVTISVTGYGT